jgi:hypothetical protein
MSRYRGAVQQLLLKTTHLLLAGVSGGSALARAATYFVEPTTGVGATASELEASTELVRHGASGMPGQALVGDRDKAQFVLRPKLTRLGKSLILTVEKLAKDDSSRVLASGQLKAASMDELDQVAARATRAAMAGTSAQTVTQVGELTEAEANAGTHRRPAFRSQTVAFGPASLNQLDASGVAYGLSYYHGFTSDWLTAKFLGEFTFKDTAFLGNLGLGGDFALTSQEHAPFLSADLGYGVGKMKGTGLFSGELISGFALGGGVGMKFMRNSTVQVEAILRYTALYAENSLGNRPSALSLKLGISF